MNWNRTLWGVAKRKYFDSEPTRPLLFCTRAQARAWCSAKNIDGRTFRPVRVRETVKIVKDKTP